MKVINIISMLNYLWCSINDILTVEGLKITDNQLSFSFDKGSYKNFRCNFSKAIINSKSLSTPTVYYCFSEWNLISTFCLLYQYSEIKNNPVFRIVIEKIYKCYQEKLYKIQDNNGEFIYNPQFFKEYLNRLDKSVKKILNGQDGNVVTVLKRGERIHIIQNTTLRCNIYKIFDDFSVNKLFIIWDKEIEETITQFNNYFYNIHIPDSLKNDHSMELDISTKNTLFNPLIVMTIIRVYPYDQLQQLLLKLNHLIITKENLLLKHLKYFEQSYEVLETKMNQNWNIPLYITLSIAKLKVKYLYGEISELDPKDIFFLYSREYMNKLYVLKDILKNSLGKIYYGKNIVNELVENLVRNCLEIDV